jgi:hypothetical protein
MQTRVGDNEKRCERQWRRRLRDVGNDKEGC